MAKEPRLLSLLRRLVRIVEAVFSIIPLALFPPSVVRYDLFSSFMQNAVFFFSVPRGLITSRELTVSILSRLFLFFL